MEGDSFTSPWSIGVDEFISAGGGIASRVISVLSASVKTEEIFSIMSVIFS